MTSFFLDQINRYECHDMLSTFNLEENHYILVIIRYVLLVLQVKLEYNVEIHLPRSSNEMYTYHSDNIWSKILFAMFYIKLNKEIDNGLLFNYIHIGGSVNLIHHWYSKFIQKGITNNKKIQEEIRYYMISTDAAFKDVNLLTYLAIDNIIKRSIYHIKDSIFIDNYMVLIDEMLSFIVKEKKVTDKIYTLFSNYLIKPFNNPCIDTENKIEISILLSNYVN